MQRFIPITFAAFLVPAVATAQDGLDDIMTGFDDTSVPLTEIPSDQAIGPEDPKPSMWDLSGTLGLSMVTNIDHKSPQAGNPDHRGLSRARTKLNLKLKGQINSNWRIQSDAYTFYDHAYRINGRADYPRQVLNNQEVDVQLGELYLQGSVTSDFDVKLGRQIIVWGKSDTIRITDVLNPIDFREPGMADIQDLRVPLSMARGDYYFGDWSVSTLVIPDIKFNRKAAYGSDYFIPAFNSGTEKKPNSGIGNAEFALALNGTFSGWDLSFYIADYYNDAPIKTGANFRHDRLKMLGGAANLAAGNWLLKGELAMQNGLHFKDFPQNRYTRGDFLLGVDYSGFTDATVTFEIADRHIMSYDTALSAAGASRDDWQMALRFDGNYLHDRLHLSALQSLSGFTGKGGGYTRLTVGYNLNDALVLTAGAVAYQTGDQLPYKVIGDNDRLFSELKWSF